MSEIVPTEDAEQMVVVAYLERRGIKFTCIPNHTYNPHRSQQNKNRLLGLRAGLPDLLIALPGTGLLFIEMKRTKGSATSQAQKDWVKVLNECPVTAAHICKGAESAIEVIESYAPLKARLYDLHDMF